MSDGFEWNKNLGCVTDHTQKRLRRTSLHPLPSYLRKVKLTPNRRTMARWSACAVVGVSVLLGCATTSLQTPSQRRPYDREASAIHPEITLHRRLDAQALDVYLSVAREELLYSRMDATSPFVSQLQVTVADTTWHLLDTAWADSPRLLQHAWTLEDAGDLQRVDVQLVDVLRNASWSTRRMLGSPEAWGASDFLMWSAHADWPLSGQQAVVHDTLTIHIPAKRPAGMPASMNWRLSHLPSPTQLPPPPFSSARMRWDTLKPTLLGTLQADSLLVLDVLDGTTLVELEDAGLALRIHGRPPSFPNLMEPSELIAPLRYIASRSEFQKLTQAPHPKQAIDAFWLACASSTENARSLLQTYYGRVEEANASFSGLVEGWRSDRGMVHIVFGVPQRIRRDAWNEYWIYGEEGTANALTFHFRKRRTRLDGNAFELQRSIQFRSVWDRGVSNWRNGRVRGD